MSRIVRERIAVGALLLIFVAQSLAAMRIWTATSDETSHLPAGYTYVTTGDLRLNPQHPPLVKMLAGAALLPLRPDLDLEDPAWTADPPAEWEFGRRFLYSNDADRLLFAGRLPVVGLAVLLGWAVFSWARELFGPPAGWVALVLYVFSPNLLAHSRIVTMDLAVSCFGFLFLWRLWRWSRDGGGRDLAAAGILLGLALASKFSAVILLPVLALLLVACASATPDRGRAAWPAAGVVVVLACVTVWAAYLFPTDPSFYVDGMRRVNQDHDPNRAYYLAGTFRVGGFWYYFLAAFLLKTPLPTLGLIGLTAARYRSLRAARWLDEAFLLVPVLAWVAVTSAFADNLGLRYLLPVYPLLFVWISRCWKLVRGRTWRAVAAGVLVAWYAGSALWVFPDHLGYFHELAGGPAGGWRWLDDSNLDWGQDLKRLKGYMEENGIEEVRLLYPWNGDPGYYGIAHERVTPSEWYEAPRPGTYAMSTVWLVRGLYEARTRGVPTDWLVRYEPAGRVGASFLIYRFDGDAGDPRSDR